MKKWKDYFDWKKDYCQRKEGAKEVRGRLFKIYEKYDKLKSMTGEVKCPAIKKKIVQRQSLEWEDYDFARQHLPSSYRDWMKKAEENLPLKETEVVCGIDESIVNVNKRIMEKKERLKRREERELVRELRKYFERVEDVNTPYLVMTVDCFGISFNKEV